MLDHPAGDSPGVIAHGGLMPDEPFMSMTGDLLPITLCGRTRAQLHWKMTMTQ